MKVKLLAIAVLVLLLCTVAVPMAASARPAPNQSKVYFCKEDRNGNDVLGSTKGTVSVSADESQITFDLKHLKPGQEYVLGIQEEAGWTFNGVYPVYGIGGDSSSSAFTAGDDGTFSATIAFDASLKGFYYGETIKGVFVVY